MISFEKIRIQLDSDNLAVLNLCDDFIDQRVEMERLRGESAERRASIILSTAGAASAFLVFLAGSLFVTSNEANGPMILIYAASALWLSRAVWYCLKSIRAQSRYRYSAESIFEFQGGSEIDALKEIIAGKLWEYQRLVQPNTERLFYVQRAQRALVVFIGLLLFLGLIVMFSNKTTLGYEGCLMVTFSIIAVLFWLFGDRLIEKVGIWNHH